MRYKCASIMEASFKRHEEVAMKRVLRILTALVIIMTLAAPAMAHKR